MLLSLLAFLATAASWLWLDSGHTQLSRTQLYFQSYIDEESKDYGNKDNIMERNPTL